MMKRDMLIAAIAIAGVVVVSFVAYSYASSPACEACPAEASCEAHAESSAAPAAVESPTVIEYADGSEAVLLRHGSDSSDLHEAHASSGTRVSDKYMTLTSGDWPSVFSASSPSVESVPVNMRPLNFLYSANKETLGKKYGITNFGMARVRNAQMQRISEESHMAHVDKCSPFLTPERPRNHLL